MDDFCKKLSFYFNEINAAHPFREGNGRTQRAFCDLLASQSGYEIDWRKANRDEYIEASIVGFKNGKYGAMESLLKKIIAPLSLKISLEKEEIDLLKNYAHKQLQLIQLTKEKHIIKNKNPTKKSLLSIHKETLKIAESLLSKNRIGIMIKENSKSSLQEQGGFIAINERLKNNKILVEDISVIFQHAKSTFSNSLLLFTNDQNKSRKH